MNRKPLTPDSSVLCSACKTSWTLKDVALLLPVKLYAKLLA